MTTTSALLQELREVEKMRDAVFTDRNVDMLLMQLEIPVPKIDPKKANAGKMLRRSQAIQAVHRHLLQPVLSRSSIPPQRWPAKATGLAALEIDMNERGIQPLANMAYFNEMTGKMVLRQIDALRTAWKYNSMNDDLRGYCILSLQLGWERLKRSANSARIIFWRDEQRNFCYTYDLESLLAEWNDPLREKEYKQVTQMVRRLFFMDGDGVVHNRLLDAFPGGLPVFCIQHDHLEELYMDGDVDLVSGMESRPQKPNATDPILRGFMRDPFFGQSQPDLLIGMHRMYDSRELVLRYSHQDQSLAARFYPHWMTGGVEPLFQQLRAMFPSVPARQWRTEAAEQILNLVERLADLQQRGVITEEEFRQKKQDLLQKI